MCVNPLSIYNRETDRTIPVPCNKCPQCVKLKINSWIFRINQQSKISKNIVFLTLTYSPEYLPHTECGKPTLYKKDVQNFMKSLRQENQYYTKDKITFYAVGEYGSKTKRPHYHILLFNVSEKIDYNRVWKKGISYPLPAQRGSFKYVLKYMSKQKTIQKNNPIQTEFSLMSKGIGANYLTENFKKYHSQLENCFLTTENGYKMPIPKYYKEKLYNDYQRPLVTEIIKNRALENETKTLKFLLKKSQNPETLLEIRKNHLKFEPRLKDVL